VFPNLPLPPVKTQKSLGEIVRKDKDDIGSFSPAKKPGKIRLMQRIKKSLKCFHFKIDILG